MLKEDPGNDFMTK